MRKITRTYTDNENHCAYTKNLNLARICCSNRNARAGNGSALFRSTLPSARRRHLSRYKRRRKLNRSKRGKRFARRNYQKIARSCSSSTSSSSMFRTMIRTSARIRRRDVPVYDFLAVFRPSCLAQYVDLCFPNRFPG